MSSTIYQITGLIVSYIFVFLIAGIAYILRKKGVSDSLARKVVHIGVGNWIILAVLLFKDWYFAVIGPLSFVLLNYLSYKRGLFGSSMELKDRKTLGTVYYAIALSILVFFFWFIRNGQLKWLSCMGILVMTWGDGMASVFGERWGKLCGGFKIGNSEKTLVGSSAMLIFSFMALSLTMLAFGVSVSNSIIYSVVLAIIATAIEAITPAGFDNLTVPLSVSFAYYAYSFLV